MNGIMMLGLLLAGAGMLTEPNRDKTGTGHAEIEMTISNSLEKQVPRMAPSDSVPKLCLGESSEAQSEAEHGGGA